MTRPPLEAIAVAVCAFLLLAITCDAAAQPDERVYVRAGVLHLAPRAESGELVLSDVSGVATLSVDDGPVAGSGVEVESLTIPALTVGCVLPVWDGRVAVETILAMPLHITMRATGTLSDESLAAYAAGDIPTGVPALGPELAETTALTPVVTLVYRFLRRRAVRPYAGLGATYLYAYDSRITNPVLTEASRPRVTIDGAAGAVGQLGVEARFLGRFTATVDVKTIAGLTVSATVRDIHVMTPALPVHGQVRVGDAAMDVALHPIIVQVGAGVSF
jgi:outer membrane protein W